MVNNAAMNGGMQTWAYVHFGAGGTEVELLNPTIILFLIYCCVPQQLLYEQRMEVPTSQHP